MKLKCTFVILTDYERVIILGKSRLSGLLDG